MQLKYLPKYSKCHTYNMTLRDGQIFSSGLGKGAGNYFFRESASPETSSFPPVCTIVGVLLFRHPQALVACTRKRSLGQTHRLGDGNENIYVSTAVALLECHSAMAVDT